MMTRPFTVRADTSRSGVGVWIDPEDGVLVSYGREIGHGSIAIDWDMRPSARHLLDIPLDDRWTLGYGNLNELTGPASSPAKHRTPISGAYVLDPVATIAEHGDEKPLSLPFRHAERKTGHAATVASRNFERYPTRRHETHALHRSPEPSEPARGPVAAPAGIHGPKIIVGEGPSRHCYLLQERFASLRNFLRRQHPN
jgi:hypothetical protein